jgi:hypothetical protein
MSTIFHNFFTASLFKGGIFSSGLELEPLFGKEG